MRNSIYWRTLATRKIGTLAFSTALLLIALMFASLYESFSGQIGTFTSSYPKEMEAFLGSLSEAATPAGWLNIELYTLFVPLIAAIIGVSFGAAAIGKEEDSGTLELLLASPVSRSRILMEKTLAMATQLVVVTGAAWVGVLIGTLLFPFEVNLMHVAAASLNAALVGFGIGCLALAAQAIQGRQALALGIGGGFLVISYFANAVSQLIDGLDKLKYISVFYYYDSAAVLNHGFQLKNLAVLAAVVVVGYIVAHISFNRRDIGV